ncbi:hypothetical protein [Zooshikella harenae]|nr:hypothetical protein [Zooshikella harenae]
MNKDCANAMHDYRCGTLAEKGGITLNELFATRKWQPSLQGRG